MATNKKSAKDTVLQNRKKKTTTSATSTKDTNIETNGQSSGVSTSSEKNSKKSSKEDVKEFTNDEKNVTEGKVKVRKQHKRIMSSPRINRGNRKWWSLGIILVIFLSKLLSNGQKAKLPYKDASYAKTSIENTFLDSWSHYVDDAFGYDMYHPLNPVGERGFNMLSDEQPLGWFVVDSVDTLMVMYNNTENAENKERFRIEIERCENWISDKLDYDIDNNNLSVFETTIRMLGGLLSAYYMSDTFQIGNSTVYLDKAVDIGLRLSNIYKTGLPIPLGKINLHSGQSYLEDGNSLTSSLAEFTTLQLEFKYLHVLRPDVFPNLWNDAESCYDVIESNNDLYGPEWDGLAPIFIDPITGKFNGRTIRLGSRGDSYYEYLIKQYIFSPKNQTVFLDRFSKAMSGVKKNLLGKTPTRKGKYNGGLTFIGEKYNGLQGPLSSKFDHLVCFIGGSLMLGATRGLTYNDAKTQTWWNDQSTSNWKLGLDITRTCYNMYSENNVTGLAPEIAIFNSDEPWKFVELQNQVPSDWWSSTNKDFFVKPADSHNLQRPETVESIFYAYQFTKSPTFRKWNWSILKSFIRSGEICLQDVTKPEDNKMNNVESFWFSETLKYIYMTFLDDVDLSSIVFNTEAHIFPTLPSRDN